MRWMLLLALISGLCVGQDEGAGGDEGCGGDTEIIVEGGSDKEGIDIIVDPGMAALPERDEPNRPAPVRVGVWPAPKLDGETRAALDGLMRARNAEPNDRGHCCRLADFYLTHRWYPHAQTEFLAAARLDKESIRPWEGLLRVYRSTVSVVIEISIGPGMIMRRTERRDNDWLSSQRERNQLIARAYREILERRPDDIERRREFVAHLQAMGDFLAMVVQAREALRRLPGDVEMRFDLAEALRRDAAGADPEHQGLKHPGWALARAELEENVRRHPDHVRSALRLIRVLCHEEGNAVEARVTELEQRAFFQLFILGDIAPLAYRKDTLRVAASLVGSRIASTLWDAAMEVSVPGWGEDREFFDRWIFIAFPNTRHDERTPLIDKLARRGDRAVAAVLLALLWHTEDTDAIEAKALAAAGGLGPACYAGAERFLGAADTPLRKKRGVDLLRRLGDARAVTPLLKVLPLDTDEELGLGVAAALETLRDARAIDGLIEAALDLRRPPNRRREAVEALAAFRDPRAIEAVKRIERDPDFDLVGAYAMFRMTGDAKAFDRMIDNMLSQGRPVEVLRLAAKCDSPRIEELCLTAIEKCGVEVRPPAIALLKERFWPGTKERLRTFFLKHLGGRNVDSFTLQVLAELGGEAVATRLLALVAQVDPDQWSTVARALAQTGDPRAVRYFNRMRILERDPDRRILADKFHQVAAKRHTQLGKKG